MGERPSIELDSFVGQNELGRYVPVEYEDIQTNPTRTNSLA
jgi:hypothetical protein